MPKPWTEEIREQASRELLRQIAREMHEFASVGAGHVTSVRIRAKTLTEWAEAIEAIVGKEERE